MKKILLSSILACLLFCVSSSAFAQGNGSGNSEINRAETLSNDCWRPHFFQFSYVQAELSGQAICTNGGTANTYNVYVYYQCPPQHQLYCKPAPPRLCASVSFDCEGNATVVCLP